ncbi:hypothetical protein [Sediminispirochaeta bajacaliforniensis]|uniref:hypothetical protein n=1 Tax=Sediminispirochaeta bajacaliforniensis TaxID=148 RepID=UPI00035D8AFF|nr:hypothetical protein [Sediminispirochaeta bajacaliforniensis]
MTGFFIKKAFFDGWDNLLSLIVLNLGLIIIIAAAAYLPMLLGEGWQVTMLVSLLAVILLTLYNGGVAHLAGEMAAYKRPDLRGLFKAIGKAFPKSFFFGLINAVHIFLLTIIVPFYYQLGGVVGLAALSLIFWISIAWWLAGQWFFPLLVQLPGDMKTILKKCFILFFDNTGFTIFMAFHALFTMLFSCLTALLMPGLSSVLLARQGALRVLMKKYDYLEEEAEADRRKIPWDALLVEERELVGHRSLKGMIFPWKE